MNSLSSIHSHGFHNTLSLAILTGTYSAPTISGYTNAYMFTGTGSITLPSSKTAQILLVGGGEGGGGSFITG